MMHGSLNDFKSFYWGDFPSGTVDKSLPANAGDIQSLVQEDSYVPWSNYARVCHSY